jgi:hypothetical protein
MDCFGLFTGGTPSWGNSWGSRLLFLDTLEAVESFAGVGTLFPWRIEGAESNGDGSAAFLFEVGEFSPGRRGSCSVAKGDIAATDALSLDLCNSDNLLS